MEGSKKGGAEREEEVSRGGLKRGPGGSGCAPRVEKGCGLR
jgi:hypothetical protein